jgi:hypothetical protein
VLYIYFLPLCYAGYPAAGYPVSGLTGYPVAGF